MPICYISGFIAGTMVIKSIGYETTMGGFIFVGASLVLVYFFNVLQIYFFIKRNL
jgi:hypothetical protein